MLNREQIDNTNSYSNCSVRSTFFRLYSSSVIFFSLLLDTIFLSCASLSLRFFLSLHFFSQTSAAACANTRHERKGRCTILEQLYTAASEPRRRVVRIWESPSFTSVRARIRQTEAPMTEFYFRSALN